MLRLTRSKTLSPENMFFRFWCLVKNSPENHFYLLSWGICKYFLSWILYLYEMRSYLNLHRWIKIAMKKWSNKSVWLVFCSSFLFLSLECYDIFLIYTLSSQIDAHTPFDMLYVLFYINCYWTSVAEYSIQVKAKHHSSNELIFFSSQQTLYFEFVLLVYYRKYSLVFVDKVQQDSSNTILCTFVVRYNTEQFYLVVYSLYTLHLLLLRVWTTRECIINVIYNVNHPHCYNKIPQLTCEWKLYNYEREAMLLSRK